MPAPLLVTEARDRSGNTLYRGGESNLRRVMSRRTAEELRALMSATITNGTGRRQFHDKETHPVLGKLTMGGKSGTINDPDGNQVDWFVAFSYITGKEGREAMPLALSGVVVHAGRTRTTSQELVRKAVISYYGPLFKDAKG